MKQEFLKLIQAISELATDKLQFGGETGTALLLACAALLFAFIALLRSRTKIPPGAFDRSFIQVSRIEKLEALFNDFKAISVRNTDTLSGEVKYLKQEIEQLRELLEQQSRPQIVERDQDFSSQSTEFQEPKTADYSALEPTPHAPLHSIDKQSLDKQSFAREVEPQPEPRLEKSKQETVDSQSIRTQLEIAPEPLSQRLTKSRLGFFQRFRGFFSIKPELDEQTISDVENLLLSGDLGVRTSMQLIQEVRQDLSKGIKIDQEQFSALLKMRLLAILEKDAPVDFIRPVARASGPMVVVLVGVNGVGKTTTAAKLAKLWMDDGAKVVLAAADTFRAAAVEQLVHWGQQVGVPVIHGPEGSKPSTIVYEAMELAKAKGFDVLIIDTAGRLHNKANLMAELEGIKNTIQKHQEDAPHEVLLVLDGSTGQNALNQAREFHAAMPLSGLIITKLDGTSKGGIVIAIKQELGTPVRYIGVGESVRDLRPFEPRAFIEALFDSEGLDSNDSEGTGLRTSARRRRRDTM